MSVEVTLSVPENLIENARRFGGATGQEVEEVLEDALELMFPMVGDSPQTMLEANVSTLSDAEVLALADSKMDGAQNRRLGELQAAERYELLTLLRIYQIGQLRKAEALAEAARRGLRQPPAG
jgi:hypothetical protein